ncbi:SpoIID/LytB domain-containing protein [Nocardioides anomalus]|uniref:SpoIID/LytB domain-containing protein n=1 Tax=Nocardioides anomalus TaxID=2712223 RepID=A0A6G6WFT1_9ACTN|nr:SpoIID/LytB domain-containing protein [Nocardioides anomalus]QIG44092.1 SpoIID/LytB domain-containing protein [Nocardioides anomalus]
MTRSLVVGLVGLLLAGSGPAATAAPRETVPAAASYTVTGYGYGHGHGLSQYGAQGAARQGLTWRQIVGFYYPGTRIGRARGPLRVLITADRRDVQVDAQPGLRLVRLEGRKTFRLDRLRPGANRWRITPQGERSVVSYRTPRGWQRWTSFPGGAQFSGGPRPMTLRLPHHEAAQYRGALRSVDRRTVNVVALDSYLRGVVPREVPAEWEAEAVRAQAVAARSYAAYERATAMGEWDLCDTEACQVYGGVRDEHPATDAAVRATRGKVVTWQGAPAFTQFSSSNGGWSTAGSQPYLVAQADPYEASSDNPNDPWTATVTRQAVERAWPAVGTLQGITLTRDGVGPAYGGHVSAVTLTGAGGQSVQLTGDAFRFGLGLRSTWLQLAPA